MYNRQEYGSNGKAKKSARNWFWIMLTCFQLLRHSTHPQDDISGCTKTGLVIGLYVSVFCK